MSSKLNVLNPEVLEGLCSRLTDGCKPHTVNWFASTWKNFLLTQECLMSVLVLEEQRPSLEHLNNVLFTHMADPSWYMRLEETDEEDDEEDEDDDDRDEDDDDEEPEPRRTREKPEPVLAEPIVFDGRTRMLQRIQMLDAYKAGETIPTPDHRLYDKWYASRRFMLDHFVFRKPEQLPDWATTKLRNGARIYFVQPKVAQSYLDLDYWKHARDYCETLPDRAIRMTVQQMLHAVFEWDKQLRRQKEAKDLEAGTQVMKDWGNGWKLVQFVSKEAFKAEGASMKHCIANYANNDRSQCFSLRFEGKPVVSLEVSKRYRCVVQARAKFNKMPTNECCAMIAEWAHSMRYSIATDAYPSKAQQLGNGEVDVDLPDEECDEDDDDCNEDGEWNM